MRDHISTAAEELVKAKAMLAEAQDNEWDNPRDPDAQRKREFWDSEVNQLSIMDPDEVIPLF